MRARASAAAFLLAGGLAVPSLFKPALLWEWLNVAAARSLAARGVPLVPQWNDFPLVIHPPSMAHLLALSLSVFGDHMWAFRLPGLLCLLLTGFLLRLTALNMGYDRRTAGLASAVYLTNPYVIQGMLCIDFADGSLLPLTVTLFFLALAACRSWSFGSKTAVLGICFCLALWAKLTTPMILALAFLFASILPRPRRGFLSAACILCFGAGLFTATFGFYCLRLHRLLGSGAPSVGVLMMEPLRYLRTGAAVPVWRLSPQAAALNFVRFILYAGPAIFLLAAPEILRWMREFRTTLRLTDRAAMLLFAMGVLAAYSMFLGGGGPYPKHFQPAMAPLSLFCAAFLARSDEEPSRTGRMLPVLLFIAGAAYYVRGVGDYLYTLDYETRIAQVSGSAGSAWVRLGVRLCLYGLPFLGLAAYRRMKWSRSNWKPCLAAALLAAQTGLCLIQARSNYDLRYIYGASLSDLRELESAIKGCKMPGPVLADPAFVFFWGAEPMREFQPTEWDNLSKVRMDISRENPKAVLYGVPVNTLSQLGDIRKDAEFRSFLASRYRLRQIGPYWLWLRRDEA